MNDPAIEDILKLNVPSISFTVMDIQVAVAPPTCDAAPATGAVEVGCCKTFIPRA